ncbi:MAG: hypothetical protein KGJ13_11680 [Patescibacteria group bacterium]|nr:hypothetical protein [Patescibacteria group bacterium]
MSNEVEAAEVMANLMWGTTTEFAVRAIRVAGSGGTLDSLVRACGHEPTYATKKKCLAAIVRVESKLRDDGSVAMLAAFRDAAKKIAPPKKRGRQMLTPAERRERDQEAYDLLVLEGVITDPERLAVLKADGT